MFINIASDAVELVRQKIKLIKNKRLEKQKNVNQ